MHPEMERQLVKEMAEQMRRSAKASRGRRVSHARAQEPGTSKDAVVVIRAARPSDTHTLLALAALDGVNLPLGRMLVAEVNGSIRAALPVDSGKSFSDPFRHTADLVTLLEARAAQIAEEPEPVHRRLAWLAPSLMRRHA